MNPGTNAQHSRFDAVRRRIDSAKAGYRQRKPWLKAHLYNAKRRLPGPTTWLAVLLGAIGLILAVLWHRTDSTFLRAWVPNLATGLWTIAVTVTVVEQTLRRQQQKRWLRPLLDDTYFDLGGAFEYFLNTLAWDYAERPLIRSHSLPSRPVSLIEQWLGDAAGDPSPLHRGDSAPFVVEGARDLGKKVRHALSEDREFLPPDLLARMRRYERSLAEARWSLGTPVEAMSVANLVVAALNLARSFQAQEKKWLRFNDAAVIEMRRLEVQVLSKAAWAYALHLRYRSSPSGSST